VKNSIRDFLRTALVATLVSNAHGATVICSGTVDVLAYHQPGRLMVRLSSMNAPVFICNTDVDYAMPGSLAGTTTPSACKAIYASLISAKLTRTPISAMYFDGNDVPTACDSFGNWKSVNVRYFGF
jgi:hypothetical protein